MARCPFLPGDEYETARKLMGEQDQNRNEQNRSKESDVARPRGVLSRTTNKTPHPASPRVRGEELTEAVALGSPAVSSPFLEQSDGLDILPDPAVPGEWSYAPKGRVE